MNDLINNSNSVSSKSDSETYSIAKMRIKKNHNDN